VGYHVLALRIRYAAKTDVGMKRTHNEDYFALIEEEQLFIVADGMGGHACGEVASKMAADSISEFYLHSRDVDATWPYRYDPKLSYTENRLVAAVRLANSRIYDKAQSDPNLRGMGTTLVCTLICDDYVYVLHVGDSRCYRMRHGKLDQLTRDHSLLEDYKDARPDMTDEEMRNFPHKNVITRALGMRDTVVVEINRYPVGDGDRYLLCSDGLSGMIPDEEIAVALAADSELDQLVAQLVDQANKRGGTDNITAMVVESRF
jgi:protein phosphatase